jgi:hypothetical protein
MQHQGTHAVSGHVFRVKRKRGPQWYVKYRLPGGKQVQKRLGLAWLNPGQPPPGYFTRTTAEAVLAAILTDARRGTVPTPQHPEQPFERPPRSGFATANGSAV